MRDAAFHNVDINPPNCTRQHAIGHCQRIFGHNTPAQGGRFSVENREWLILAAAKARVWIMTCSGKGFMLMLRVGPLQDMSYILVPICHSRTSWLRFHGSYIHSFSKA